jgi:hypothetical protein
MVCSYRRLHSAGGTSCMGNATAAREPPCLAVMLPVQAASYKSSTLRSVQHAHDHISCHPVGLACHDCNAMQCLDAHPESPLIGIAKPFDGLAVQQQGAYKLISSSAPWGP